MVSFAQLLIIKVECQRADWKRHKKEPCLPYDELIRNDDLWDIYGQRKGTGDPRFQIAD